MLFISYLCINVGVVDRIFFFKFFDPVAEYKFGRHLVLRC